MIIIEPYYKILTPISEGGVDELRRIEEAARTCYKSSNDTDDIQKTKDLVKRMIDSGHEAMLEHSQLSVKFVCDRGVSHEIVRHRLCSFAQESTRYCNYSKKKFNSGITVISPSWHTDNCSEAVTQAYLAWFSSCLKAEAKYLEMLKCGLTTQQARGVLPTSLKTEIVVTGNYREWRHMLKLRTAKDAHPDIRLLMCPLLKELKEKLPIVYDDIQEE